ncbi:hypothetical protein [Clostridium sp. HBUAS56010]|uniref:hypothetical protein n=1 Tax=Clostridium sp. HBUAS56010 TaxID=2571127 RepID=UPI001178C7E9|nr:hypothetical protein [Clostridium sp. HBUAS56010]
MEYEKHDCGGEIVDCEPSYIPLGKDSVLQIIDQKCKKCGTLIVGKYQKTKMIKNQEAHDKLYDLMTKSLHG